MAGAMPSDHDALAGGTWLPDPSHYPEQMAPLSATVWFEAVGKGLHDAMRQLRGPFGGFDARTELGWAYERELQPDWEPDIATLQAAARALDETWRSTTVHRVHAITDELLQMRPEAPDPAGAVELLDRMWSLVREQWKLHFLTVIPAQIAIELFHEAYVEHVRDDDPLAPYLLLDGLETERTEADYEIWRLAELARELGVDDILREYPPTLAIERLGEFGHGRTFLHHLNAYLLRFGGRARWHELSVPREAENPSMTVESIRLFLEGGAPPTGRAAERERREVDFLTRFPGLAPVLEAAMIGYGLKESHVYHLDYPGLLAVREVLQGAGRRLLAEGRIAVLDDVWMLRRDELRTAVCDPEGKSLEPLVAERRAELEQGLAEGVRPYLGLPPPQTERHAVLERFYGSLSGEAKGDASGTILHGTAASTGSAEGIARIVASPEDFRRVRPGEILVVTTTTPAWTPLFPSLAGLVTETGGILCHAAVVAREYDVPAVVGVERATRIIRDGARIRVDGSTGMVEIMAQAIKGPSAEMPS